MKNVLFLKIAVFFICTLAVMRICLQILINPFSWIKGRKRKELPKCLVNSDLGVHKYRTANGIKFHYVETGAKDKPLILFLHGFPEFWFSWRHQLLALKKHYHVIALDLRGYGEATRQSVRITDFNTDHLAKDIKEFIIQSLYSQAIIVGHGWGGVLGWWVAYRYPEMVRSLVIINSPHPEVYAKAMATSFSQNLKSWYINLFLPSYIPEFFLAINDFTAFDLIFRTQNKNVYTLEIMEAYKHIYSTRPGLLTNALNYYRCAIKNPQKMKFEDEEDKETGSGNGDLNVVDGFRYKITIPTLLIWGDDDVTLDRSLADIHTDVATNIKIKHIMNCSHWAQNDQPEDVNACIMEFLEEREVVETEKIIIKEEEDRKRMELLEAEYEEAEAQLRKYAEEQVELLYGGAVEGTEDAVEAVPRRLELTGYVQRKEETFSYIRIRNYEKYY